MLHVREVPAGAHAYPHNDRAALVRCWSVSCGCQRVLRQVERPKNGGGVVRLIAAGGHTMADLQAHRDMLDQALREAIVIIEELCTAHKHPEPEASMTRMQKALDFDA